MDPEIEKLRLDEQAYWQSVTHIPVQRRCEPRKSEPPFRRRQVFDASAVVCPQSPIQETEARAGRRPVHERGIRPHSPPSNALPPRPVPEFKARPVPDWSTYGMPDASPRFKKQARQEQVCVRRIGCH